MQIFFFLNVYSLDERYVSVLNAEGTGKFMLEILHFFFSNLEKLNKMLFK